MSAPKLDEVQRLSDIILVRLLEELGESNAAKGAVVLVHTLGRLCGLGGIPNHDAGKYWKVVVDTFDMRTLFCLAFEEERQKLRAKGLVTSLTKPSKPSDPNAN